MAYTRFSLSMRFTTTLPGKKSRSGTSSSRLYSSLASRLHGCEVVVVGGGQQGVCGCVHRLYVWRGVLRGEGGQPIS